MKERKCMIISIAAAAAAVAAIAAACVMIYRYRCEIREFMDALKEKTRLLRARKTEFADYADVDGDADIDE